MNEREKKMLEDVESLIEKSSGKPTLIIVSNLTEEDEENYYTQSACVHTTNDLDICKYIAICTAMFEKLIDEASDDFRQALSLGLLKAFAETLNYKMEIKKFEQ